MIVSNRIVRKFAPNTRSLYRNNPLVSQRKLFHQLALGNRFYDPPKASTSCYYQILKGICSSKTNLQPEQLDQKAGRFNQPANFSLAPHVDENFSYSFGRSHCELINSTLGSVIDYAAKREPHSTAVVVYDEGISKSFEEFHLDLNKLINGLVEKLNLKRGKKVGIFSYNNYQYLLLQFACAKLGIIFNPINPSYKAHELSYIIQNANLDVLFVPGKNSKQSYLNDHWSIICDKSFTELQASGALTNLKHVVILDGEYEEKDMALRNIHVNRWQSIFTRQNNILEAVSEHKLREVRSDDIYGVYYTSGTTGFPKGAAVTQFNVINNVALSAQRLFVQRGPKFEAIRPNICLPLPLFHEFAGVLGILTPFVSGGSFVITGMKYDIKTVYDAIMRFKCNTIFLTPTILIDLLGYINKNKCLNLPLKTMLVAGSSVLPELVEKAYKNLPNLEEVRIGYGSSENGVIATIQTTLEEPESRLKTVGPPLDFTEVRIVDTASEEILPLGEKGEVQTRGFNTMLCYYNDQEKTNAAITPSRWYRTGDLGVMDKFGSLSIVGRIKDLIIKGGENIYPAEVENVLHSFNLIEDAHVIGVPDERYGEEVCAWIKLNSKPPLSEEQIKQDIIEFCRQKLAYFKVPRHIIFVDEFPLTPVKKIKKFEMRVKTAEMLNLK